MTFFATLAEKAQIVLCDYVTDELRRVSQRKFPDKAHVIDTFLAEFPYELAKTITLSATDNPQTMRDPKDAPILMTAIAAKVDVLVSGDKDFLVLDVGTPQILTMKDFVAKYG